MKASDALAKAISQANLRRLAGDRYYERGLAYFEQGAVYSLERSGDSLNALVVGSEEYEVRLLVKGQKLDHRCDCPLGFDGEFCKHCVAVGLAWLDQQETCSPQPAEVTELAKALQAKDKTVLVKLLLDHAEEDDIFRERLLLLAAGPKGPTVAHTKKMLAKAMQIRGFMDYHHMPAYAAAVEGALDAVEAVLQGGEAAATVDLCEDGLRNLLTAIAQADDSDGYMSQLMERLLALHLRACEAVRPDPDQLARTLFSFALNSEYGEWSGCAERYANVLGKQGLSTFRKLAETEWANVPPITQRDTGTDSGNRFLVTDLMESLARQSGDLEELVGVLERDLSSPHRFLRIAHVYREAGNHERPSLGRRKAWPTGPATRPPRSVCLWLKSGNGASVTPTPYASYGLNFAIVPGSPDTAFSVTLPAKPGSGTTGGRRLWPSSAAAYQQIRRITARAPLILGIGTGTVPCWLKYYSMSAGLKKRGRKRRLAAVIRSSGCVSQSSARNNTLTMPHPCISGWASMPSPMFKTAAMTEPSSYWKRPPPCCIR
jgi:hypothetical protein